nr:TIGR00296 family protein [uncultured Methanospirillum sp.]
MELLTADEGRLALTYARSVLHEHIAGTLFTEPSWPAVFSEQRGVFVTLTIHGDLRGCIGFPYPVLPLKEAIHDAACSASTGDPRFPPVKPEELSRIAVEVTILTQPSLLEAAPDQRDKVVEVGRHGLIVKGYGRSGLLLPQVPVEWGWNTREFLDHTCNKAGLPAKSWLEASVQVFTFEGQIFSEKHD